MKEYKVPHLPLRYTGASLAMAVVVILLFALSIAFFAFADLDNEARDGGKIVKECVVGDFIYCRVQQITNLETGCVTVVAYSSGFSGPSAVDISCPGEE